MISVAEADTILAASFRPMGSELVALQRAHGRVLREEVLADRDYPPFDRVAMDGIALCRQAYVEGLRDFSVQGVQPAGLAPQVLHDPAHCFEAMTGAVLPHGCDAVIRYEDLRVDAGIARVLGEPEVNVKSHVHVRGADALAGQRLLAVGTRLGPPQLAVLASVGKALVPVARRPSIVFISTGDELVPVDASPAAHQIRGSNGAAIAGALAMAGYEDVTLRHCPDSPAALAAEIERALMTHDLVLISGGVSMGKLDYVPKTLGSLGVRELFHKIAQKPGKPLWFGLSADDKPVFGLPGNPVSSLICLYRYVLPALARAAGAPAAPSCAVQLTSYRPLSKAFTHFVAVRVHDGIAQPVATAGSGDFVSLTSSDGFVEVAPQASLERAPFHPWSCS